MISHIRKTKITQGKKQNNIKQKQKPQNMTQRLKFNILLLVIFVFEEIALKLAHCQNYRHDGSFHGMFHMCVVRLSYLG